MTRGGSALAARPGQLTGFRVGITNDRRAGEYVAAFERRGAEVVHAPTIQTGTEDEAATAGQELNRYLVENAWFAPMYRPTSIFMSDANTQVTTQVGNAVPYLWNVQPK